MDDFEQALASQYEKARREGKSRIRAHAEDKPLTFTGAALVVGFVLGGLIL